VYRDARDVLSENDAFHCGGESRRRRHFRLSHPGVPEWWRPK
jgi:hypothetical protein